MSAENLLVSLLNEISQAVAPLQVATENAQNWQTFCDTIGWNLDLIPGLDPVGVTAAVAEIGRLLASLQRIKGGGDTTLPGIIGGLEAAAAVTGSIQELSLLPTSNLDGLPSNLLGMFVTDVVSFISEGYLRRQHPLGYQLLVVLGIVQPGGDALPTDAIVDPSTQKIIRASERRPFINVTALGHLLEAPGSWLRSRFVPQGVDADHLATSLASLVLPRLADVVVALGGQAAFGGDVEPVTQLGSDEAAAVGRSLYVQQRNIPDDETVESQNPNLSEVIVSLGLTIGEEAGQLALVLTPSGDVSFSSTRGAWTLSVDARASLGDLVITPSRAYWPGDALSVERDAQGGMSVAVERYSGNSIVIGGSSGPEIGLSTPSIAVGVALDRLGSDVWVTAKTGTVYFSLRAEGFLSALLPSGGLKASFFLDVKWSARHGIALNGGLSAASGLGLKWSIGSGLAVGPVRLPILSVAIEPVAKGVSATVAADLIVALGPVVLSLDGVGSVARIAASGGTGGNLGIADLSIGLQPPTGGGVSVQLSECWGPAPFAVVYFTSSITLNIPPFGGPASGDVTACAFGDASFSAQTAP